MSLGMMTIELNSDLQNFAVVTINISTESGYDEFNSQIASLLPNTKFIGNLRRKYGAIDNSNFIAGYKVNDLYTQAITTDRNTIKVLLVNNGITSYKEVQFLSN